MGLTHHRSQIGCAARRFQPPDVHGKQQPSDWPFRQAEIRVTLSKYKLQNFNDAIYIVIVKALSKRLHEFLFFTIFDLAGLGYL